MDEYIKEFYNTDIEEFYKGIDNEIFVERSDVMYFFNNLGKDSSGNPSPKVLDFLNYLLVNKNPFSVIPDSEFKDIVYFNKLKFLYYSEPKDDTDFLNILSDITKNSYANLTALLLIATYFVTHSKFALAFRLFNEANALMPRFENRKNISITKTMIYANMASLFIDAGQYDNAEKYYFLSKEILPKDNNSYEFLVICINILRARFLSGKINSGEYLKALEEVEVNNVENSLKIKEFLALYRSSCYISDNDYLTAIQAINEFIEQREPISEELIINLLICYYNLEMYDEYEVLYKKEIDRLITFDKLDPKFNIIKYAIDLAKKNCDENWEIECLYHKVNFNSIYYKNRNLFLLEIAQNEHQLKINEKQLDLERKKAQNQLVYNIELLSKNKELEQFASIVAHDIKSPLRSTVNLLGILEFSLDLDEDELEIFNSVKDSNKRLDQFVDDLVNYAKHGNSEDAYSYIDLNKTLEEVQILLKEYILENKASINIKTKLPSIYAYDSACIQLFLNLLNNSIKFKKTDRLPQIDIWHEIEQDNVYIFLKDNGVGIKEDDMDTIFQAFKRGHTKNKIEGIGIGLATCQKIIDNINAKISVESTVDLETTFKIEIAKDLTKV